MYSAPNELNSTPNEIDFIKADLQWKLQDHELRLKRIAEYEKLMDKRMSPAELHEFLMLEFTI